MFFEIYYNRKHFNHSFLKTYIPHRNFFKNLLRPLLSKSLLQIWFKSLKFIAISFFIARQKISKIVFLFIKVSFNNTLTRLKNLLKKFIYYYFLDYSDFIRDSNNYNSIEFINSKSYYESISSLKQFETLIHFNSIARSEIFFNDYHINSDSYDNSFFVYYITIYICFI